MLRVFSGHVPAFIATGPRHTGKTFAALISVAHLGTNAADISILKDSTMSAIKARYSKDPFPIIMHDFQEGSTVAAILNECYEGRNLLKHEHQMTPLTSIAITCNEGQMSFLQQR